MEVPEEVQQAANEWYSKQKQCLRAVDHANMCLVRERAAYQRFREQDFAVYLWQFAKAVLFCGPWPWADAWMWHTQYRRAEQLVRELEREQRAIEKEYHLVRIDKESETN